MKNLLFGFFLSLLATSGLYAQQWASSDSNSVYNTNPGYVGIGTNSPKFLVDLNDTIDDYNLRLTRNSIYNNWLYFSNNNQYGASGLRFLNDQGIGSQVVLGGSSNYFFPNEFAFDQIMGSIAFSARTGFIDFRTVGPFSSNSAMRILNNGNVGIGMSTPTVKLDVNGTIHSGKIFVDKAGSITRTDFDTISLLAVNGTAVFEKARVAAPTSAWPDYVFEPDYQQPSLESLEQFIKLNKHLPDVPSASDVKKDGFDVGENQSVLLKKIEELTLIIIEQNKQQESLKDIITKQNERMDEMDSKIKSLSKAKF